MYSKRKIIRGIRNIPLLISLTTKSTCKYPEKGMPQSKARIAFYKEELIDIISALKSLPFFQQKVLVRRFTYQKFPYEIASEYKTEAYIIRDEINRGLKSMCKFLGGEKN